jgi:CBS domain-containing protein
MSELEGIRAMLVKEVMTTDLVTVDTLTVMSKVASIFEEHNFHHIPVIDKEDSSLVGIISMMDVALLKDWGTRLNIEYSKETNEKLFKSLLAKDVMKLNPVCISPEDNIDRCVDILDDNHFHALPVIENDQLVGLITTYDLIRLAYR